MLTDLEHELQQVGREGGSTKPNHVLPDAHGPAKQSPIWLGVYGDDFRARGYRGVRVARVVPGSPAARAGLLGAADPAPPFIEQLGIPWTGHIILAVDSRPVRAWPSCRSSSRDTGRGEQALITVTVGPGAVTGETIVDLEAPPAPPAH